MQFSDRAITRLGIVLIVGGGAWILVQFANYLDIFSVIQQTQVQEERVAENRQRLEALINEVDGVSPLEATQGFWYTYHDRDGNRHVFFFDMETLARLGLSDADLAKLKHVLENSEFNPREQLRFRGESELPAELQFHNEVYSFGTRGSTTQELTGVLEQRLAAGAYTADDLFRLGYLYELNGEYAKRDEVYARSCEEFGELCADEGVTMTITGRVVDQVGDGLPGAEVSVLSKPALEPQTVEDDGSYSFTALVQPPEKIRLRATREGFIDGFTDALIITKGRDTLAADPIELSGDAQSVTLNLDTGEIGGGSSQVREDGTFMISATASVYELPPHALFYRDGTPASGEVDVRIFEFTEDTVPESFMMLDTFEDEAGYVGDRMQTFGMPYIQFFDADGEELHVFSDNPLRLTYRFPGLQALKEGNPPLTESQIALMRGVSESQSGYPIDNSFLIANGLTHMPPFWVFDRQRGVWDNVGMRLLDEGGLIQTPFYTLKNRP